MFLALALALTRDELDRRAPLVDAAHAELEAAFAESRRIVDATDDLGAGMMVNLDAMVALYHRLSAEHGDEAGPAIWRAALARQRRVLDALRGQDAA